MKRIYVSNTDKPVRFGNPQDFIGVEVEKHKGGFVLTVEDDDRAYRIAQALMNSGYETVQIIGGSI